LVDGLEIGQHYAVKILIPPSPFARFFRNAIYGIAYQGAFSAQVNGAAARVGVLWQKLARRAARIRLGSQRAIADTHATFYDGTLGAFGEINEWVEGRIWRFETDDEMFRRSKSADPTTSKSREDLEKRAPRAMGVLQPFKVVIENYPEDQIEEFEFPNHPDNPEMGTRMVPFSREIYIEQDDFREDPPKKFFRLAPGREVRLRFAYLITCTGVIKDPDTGEVVELRCTYDPATKGGDAPDGRKVKGTLHWVSAAHALPAEVRLYDHLFTRENPNDVEPGKDFLDYLNPDSLVVLNDCRVEPGLADAGPGLPYQFERKGYFVVDSVDSKPGALVFNRTVSLRDSWAKIEQAQKQE